MANLFRTSAIFRTAHPAARPGSAPQTRLSLLLVLPLLLTSAVPALSQAAATPEAPGDTLGDALRRCASPQGCSLQIPSQSTLKGEDPAWRFLGDNLVARGFLYPPNTHLEDRRLGRGTAFASNVGDHNQGFAFLTRFDRNLPSDPAGPQQANIVASYFTGAPASYNYGAETVTHNMLLTSVFSSKGIAQAIGSVAHKLGTGDFGGQYFYNTCMGGAINGDDEGCNAFYSSLWEGWGDANGETPRGTLPIALIQSVGTVGAGRSSLRIKLTGPRSWNIAIGAGRFAVLARTPDGKDAALHRFTILSHNDTTDEGHVGTFTVAEAAPVSAVWGRSTQGLRVPNNNDVAQTVTTTVAIDPLSPQAATGYRKGIACMWSWVRNERVEIVDAPPPAAGHQTLTVKIRQDPAGGGQQPRAPFFFQDAPSGGLCQTVGRVAAYDGGPGLPSQNIPLMGAILLKQGETISHTVVYNFNWIQGNYGAIAGIQDAMPITIPATLKRIANRAIIIDAKTDPGSLNEMSHVTVTGAADPTFNTQSTTVHRYAEGFGYESKGADTGRLSATLVGGAGRNVLKVYPAAEIIAVDDPSLPSTRLGEFVALESNSIAWPVNGLVDFPAHHSIFLQMSSEQLRSSTPGFANGKVFNYDGPSASGRFSAFQLMNDNPASQYLGSGGFMTGPNAVLIAGPHQTIFNFASGGAAPLLPGGNVSLIGCVTGDCRSRSAYFTLEQVFMRDARFVRQFDQFNRTALIGFQGGESLVFKAGAGIDVNASLSMKGRAVHDLADPVQPGDAVNLKTLQTAVSGSTKATARGYTGSLTLSPSCAVTVTNGLITGKTGC